MPQGREEDLQRRGQRLPLLAEGSKADQPREREGRPD